MIMQSILLCILYQCDVLYTLVYGKLAVLNVLWCCEGGNEVHLLEFSGEETLLVPNIYFGSTLFFFTVVLSLFVFCALIPPSSILNWIGNTHSSISGYSNLFKKRRGWLWTNCQSQSSQFMELFSRLSLLTKWTYSLCRNLHLVASFNVSWECPELEKAVTVIAPIFIHSELSYIAKYCSKNA